MLFGMAEIDRSEIHSGVQGGGWKSAMLAILLAVFAYWLISSGQLLSWLR
jgi:hypothetical protein